MDKNSKVQKTHFSFLIDANARFSVTDVTVSNKITINSIN